MMRLRFYPMFPNEKIGHWQGRRDTISRFSACSSRLKKVHIADQRFLGRQTMPKLPVLPTVGKSYRFVIGNFQLLGESGARWAVAAGIAFVVSHLLVRLPSDDHMPPFEELPAGARVAEVTGLSVSIILLAMYFIVVRWHRTLILDTAPTLKKSTATGRAILYMARSTFLGMASMAIFALMALLPIPLLRALSFPMELMPAVFSIYIPATFVATLLIIGRFCLILPGGAVGHFAMTLRKSWQHTRGNGWRILLGSVLAAGPVFFANTMFNSVFDSLPYAADNTMVLTLVLAQSLALLIVAAVIQASFLSYVYLFFSEPPAPTLSAANDQTVHAPPAFER